MAEAPIEPAGRFTGPAVNPTGVPDFATIEQRREALGVDQGELCRRAGISHATYSRLRHGRVSAARASTRRALADALEAFAQDRAERLARYRGA